MRARMIAALALSLSAVLASAVPAAAAAPAWCSTAAPACTITGAYAGTAGTRKIAITGTLSAKAYPNTSLTTSGSITVSPATGYAGGTANFAIGILPTGVVPAAGCKAPASTFWVESANTPVPVSAKGVASWSESNPYAYTAIGPTKADIVAAVRVLSGRGYSFYVFASVVNKAGSGMLVACAKMLLK
jgi:hypothetical protein